jgi:hypothetical protein
VQWRRVVHSFDIVGVAILVSVLDHHNLTGPKAELK